MSESMSDTEIKWARSDKLDPNWKCYLFGNKPSGEGLVYVPSKGQVPNWFIRWMMRVCLGCTWIKESK